MDKKDLLLSGFKITSDANFPKELNPVPYELDIQLEDLYKLALKGKESAIKKFIRLIDRYPKVPALKNYLSVLYSNMGKIEKSLEVNHWIVAEHPDYLFGKLNLAAEYITKKKFDKIPEVLGKSMDLKELYPERDTFHIAEVSSFFRISVLYYCAIGNLEQAEIRLDILKELVPDSEDLEIAEKHFSIAIMEANFDKMKKAREKLLNVKVNKTILTEIKAPPEFKNELVYALYNNGFSIDEQIITELLALPRQSLIEDLNMVLKDSIIRFNYFNTKADNEQHYEGNYDFVVHALFLLAEINARESLNSILEVLRQDNDYIDLYFGDILTEYMWLVLYKTASSDLDTCKRFMFEPGIYTYSKAAVSEMVNQIAQHQPERKNEVIEWFRDVFRFFLNSSPDDNVIDSDLLGALVNDVLDFKGIELMPEIEELYNKEIVDLSACGNIEDVKEHFADSRDSNHKLEIESIFQIYEGIKSWSGYIEQGDIDDEMDDYSIKEPKKVQPVVKPKKIGRNDPCPCGSGKKYKKCCMNKEK